MCLFGNSSTSTSQLRNSGDARDDSVQLEQRERDTPVSPGKAAKERVTSSSLRRASEERERSKAWP